MRFHPIVFCTYATFAATVFPGFVQTLENGRWESSPSPVPVILWHGMGDTCCNPDSLGRIKPIFQQELPPGTIVEAIKIGDTVSDDLMHSYLGRMDQQVSVVCNFLQNNASFANGYHAVGFSQGGLFVRALAQKCSTPQMKTLVSIGGPQQGVAEFPHCTGSHFYCELLRKALDYGAYTWEVQERVIQAQYWHDYTDEDEYTSKNIFLPDLNQEKTVNSTYKANMMRLEKFVLVRFLKDTMVVPGISEWFGFYKPGKGKEIYNLTESDLYKQDKLGLKTLDDQKKLHFESFDSDHLQMTEEQLRNLIRKYLE